MPACAAFEPIVDPCPYLAWLDRRFGIAPEALDGHRWWRRRGARAAWIASAHVDVDAAWCIEAVGLVAFRKPPPRGYPTTAFVARFGHHATRRIARVDVSQAEALLRGHSIAWEAPPQEGPVVVRSPYAVLGRGWVRRGRLDLELRREWRRRMAGALAAPGPTDAVALENPARNGAS